MLRSGDVVHFLVPGVQLVGRAVDVDVALDDRLASRRHAEIEVVGDAVRIRDLGSRNGIMVDGRRVQGSEWIALEDKSHVTIGSTRLVVLEERVRDSMKTAPARPKAKRTLPQQPIAPTGSSATYETFLAEADRAATRGDLERLESATDLLIDTLTAALRQGMPGDPHAVRSASNHALFLAGSRGPADHWLARVFRLATAARAALPMDALSRIERLLGPATVEARDALEVYARELDEELSATTRGRAFLTQLERLRRVSSAARAHG